MNDHGIDKDVKDFILKAINSFEHIEILLLLHAHPKIAWTAKEVSDRLRNSQESVSRRLADLTLKGLLRIDPVASDKYVYGPQDALLEQIVTKLAKVYSERKVSVINLIFSKPTDQIQVFAEAFRLRSDKD